MNLAILHKEKKNYKNIVQKHHFDRGHGRRFRPVSTDIAMVTTLEALHGRKVLFIGDVENLSFSAQRLGYNVSFRLLGEKLKEICHSVRLHAYYSRQPGRTERDDYFRERGWIPHPQEVETVHSFSGAQKVNTNSDNKIAFAAGLASHSSGEAIILLATGDGQLASDLATCLKALPRPRTVFTLSLAGSTSHRLDSRKNKAIDLNIELGRDLLRRI